MINASKVAGAFTKNDDGSYSLDPTVEKVHSAMVRYGVPKLHNTGIRILNNRVRLVAALITGNRELEPEEIIRCKNLEDSDIELRSSNEFSLKVISDFNDQVIADFSDEGEESEAA